MLDFKVFDNGKDITLPAWITTGALKDRLGVDALAISASSNPVCVAVKEMLYDRKYVDLVAEVTSVLFDMLIAANEPAANPIFTGSGPMTAAKKARILNVNIANEERP